MNFLTILGIFLCGGTVLIGADYYLEFRAPAGASSSRGSQRLANYLYKCEGVPAGSPAYTVGESVCTAVTGYEQRVDIHMTCNFYSVHNPNLQGHVMRFSDRRRVVLSDTICFVGFKNNAIDHPNFADSNVDDLMDWMAKVEEMPVDVRGQQQSMDNVALYLAKTNVVYLSGAPNYFNNLLSAYAAALHRLTYFYGYIDQNAATAEANRERYGAAMKVLLEKMIDPCAVLPGQETVGQHCERYCNFLTVVARHFGPVSNRCTSFQGGHCVSRVCTCTQVLANPLAGCSSTTSPMQLCNNEMRLKLRL